MRNDAVWYQVRSTSVTADGLPFGGTVLESDKQLSLYASWRVPCLVLPSRRKGSASGRRRENKCALRKQLGKIEYIVLVEFLTTSSLQAVTTAVQLKVDA